MVQHALLCSTHKIYDSSRPKKTNHRKKKLNFQRLNLRSTKNAKEISFGIFLEAFKEQKK